MNREEAKLPITDNSTVHREIVRVVNEHIDTIYDDFESRTCENCLHYSYVSLFGDDFKQWNCLGQDGFSTVVSCPPKDFGCNKFERKEDDNL